LALLGGKIGHGEDDERLKVVVRKKIVKAPLKTSVAENYGVLRVTESRSGIAL
jgi:hypothetical protein